MENKKKKSTVILYAVAIVLSLAALCSVIFLLLSRDSDTYKTTKLAETYYSCIQDADKSKMESLFCNEDISEIIKSADSFENYFDNVYGALKDEYGEGFTIKLSDCKYTEFDKSVKESFNEAYGADIQQGGLLNFNISISCAPSASLDGGQQIVTANRFNDNLVVLKIGGKWYPAVSVGLANGLCQRYLTAIELESKTVSIAEYNFFYNMLSKMYESDDGESSVSDSQTISFITQVYILCDKAQSDGFEPSEDDVKAMEEELADIKKTADSFEKAAEKYYSAYYGLGMTYELLHDVYYSQLLMQSYISKIGGSIEFTDEMLENYYKENRNEFDKVDFIYYELFSSVEGSLDELEEKAQSILDSSSTLEEFTKNCEAVYNSLTDEQKALGIYGKSSYNGESFTYNDFEDIAANFRDWAFSDGRVEGDKKYFTVFSGDEDFGYITVMAYMINPRHREEYNTADIMFLTALTENQSEEEALEKINAAFDRWSQSDKTDESFSEIANEFYDSEDESLDGGSYVLIAKGDMSSNIDEWIFDEGRREGDCEIITSDIGCHLVYFIGYDIKKWELDAKSMISEDKVRSVYEDALSKLDGKILSMNIVMYC